MTTIWMTPFLTNATIAGYSSSCDEREIDGVLGNGDDRRQADEEREFEPPQPAGRELERAHQERRPMITGRKHRAIEQEPADRRVACALDRCQTNQKRIRDRKQHRGRGQPGSQQRVDLQQRSWPGSPPPRITASG